ncbi:hypothetical protein MMC16_006464 [Acarospora aff. strigata]|nr:hypothetical protein [Acarospora aff. strigata]
MLKKPSILLSSYGSFHTLCCPHHQVHSTSPSFAAQRSSPSLTLTHRGRKLPQYRTYADVHLNASNDVSNKNDNNLQWPEPPNSTKIPTPYQIFQQRKDSPYSKHRFYELVKLYHPDRPHPACTYPISHATRLERYRLVVAANTILSDPLKRTAYDRYGAGWNGAPEIGSSRHGPHGWATTAGTGWASYTGPDSPAHNATWEDWERWYQRDIHSNGKGARPPPQEPLYFSNSVFVSLIVLFAALGSFGQVTRVGDYSRTFIEQIESVHDDCSKDLMRRRRRELLTGSDMGGNKDRDERIQNFLKMRDPDGSAGEEGYRRLLPAPEICSSGDTHQG